MFFAQGGDFPGQKPYELNALCRCAGNKVVVPMVRHLVYGCVISVHTLKVPFSPHYINQIVAPMLRISCTGINVEFSIPGAGKDVMSADGSENDCIFSKLESKTIIFSYRSLPSMSSSLDSFH